jgi:hypothetical protein
MCEIMLDAALNLPPEKWTKDNEAYRYARYKQAAILLSSYRGLLLGVKDRLRDLGQIEEDEDWLTLTQEPVANGKQLVLFDHENTDEV